MHIRLPLTGVERKDGWAPATDPSSGTIQNWCQVDHTVQGGN